MPDKTPKPNLFATAKKVDKKETKSKTTSLNVPEELEQPIKDYVEAKAECTSWETKMNIAEAVIKEKAKEIYLEEYKKQGRNIGSFKLGAVTISIQDKYSKIDANVATIIEKTFPAVVIKTTEYLFNQEILNKYINEISEALQNATGIPEQDLAALIEAKEITSIKKGTIDTLAIYGNNKIYDLFQAISPIISMR